MKFVEFASTGAALTSVFHQLFAGNNGSGTGITPPWVAAEAVTEVSARTTSSENR